MITKLFLTQYDNKIGTYESKNFHPIDDAIWLVDVHKVKAY